MDYGTWAGALNNYRSFGKPAYYIRHVGDPPPEISLL